MKISWLKSKKHLAVLWFTGAGILFLIILFQSVLGHYGDNIGKAWNWLLPCIMPTLSLIIGVLVSDSVSGGTHDKEVDKFMFRLSFILSFIYLFVVLLTILMQPFSAYGSIKLFEQSNLWLAPFQGLVAASLGAFFIRREKNENAVS